MSNSLMITLPIYDKMLADEMEETLSAHANIIRLPIAAFDLDTIKVVIDIVGGSVSIAADVAAIVTFVLAVKDRERLAKNPSGVLVGKPGEKAIPLEDVDERLLCQLLGIENSETIKNS